MNLVLKSAMIIDENASTHHQKIRDIEITNGVITKIGEKLPVKNDFKEITYPNLHVSIGWFDSGVSFGEPGFEERETMANGLSVTAKSGFSDIVLNPTTKPIPDTNSNIAFLKHLSSNNATKVHPLGTLTVQQDGIDLAELFDMKNAGAVGFYDYKQAVTNANLLKLALQYTQNFNGLVYSFPSEIKIHGKGMVNEGAVSTRLGLKGIPAFAEELQIARDLSILEYTGGQLHIPTISSAKAVALIKTAKAKGLKVSCSVALHNLCFTDETLDGFDTHYKVMPPLRTEQDRKALVKGVKDGIIDLVTTDHMPIDIEHKRVEFDNAMYGSIGIEHAFGMLHKLFGLEKAISVLTTGRDIFNINTPVLKEGAEANITLFNPEHSGTYHQDDILSTSKNSMYLSAAYNGKVYGVIANKINTLR